MDIFRLKHTIGLFFCLDGKKRAQYIRKHNVFKYMGENCDFMPRIVPLYPKLIKLHDNVSIASGVTFITHDFSFSILNKKYSKNLILEKKGCIEIGSNCYIGARVLLMPNIKVNDNIIVGAGSIVTRDLKEEGVYVGIPAKKIMDFNEFLKKNLERTKNDENMSDFDDIWNNFYRKRELYK